MYFEFLKPFLISYRMLLLYYGSLLFTNDLEIHYVNTAGIMKTE